MKKVVLKSKNEIIVLSGPLLSDITNEPFDKDLSGHCGTQDFRAVLLKKIKGQREIPETTSGRTRLQTGTKRLFVQKHLTKTVDFSTKDSLKIFIKFILK